MNLHQQAYEFLISNQKARSFRLVVTKGYSLFIFHMVKAHATLLHTYIAFEIVDFIRQIYRVA